MVRRNERGGQLLEERFEKVFKLQWGTLAAATHDLEKMREAARHSMDSELVPLGGVEARQVNYRVHRDDFWRRTCRSYIYPETWMLSASGPRHASATAMNVVMLR